MAVYRSYECPDCLGRFRFLHHPNDEPPPNYCPLCGNCMTADPSFVPQAPHIAKSIGKTADNVYRQMEEGSKVRMEAAAAVGGGDASDYSALKITNMADRLREGDVAAPRSQTAISRHMAQTGQGGFNPIAGMTPQQHAQAAHVGPYPRAGEMARQQIVQLHQRIAPAMQRQSEIGRVER